MPVPSRRRHRAAVLVLAAATAVSTAACTSGGAADRASSASSAPPTAGGTYLALGDSVPFGYRAGESDEVYGTAADFTGFPELVGRSRGLDVVNAACPGETSASFLDTTAASNGCESSPTSASGFRTDFPLHTTYASPTQPQADLAVDVLRRTADVRLVTLMVGANDAFLCQATTSDGCVTEVGTVATAVEANIGTVLQRLRTDGGYTGKVVVVTYYSLDYADRGTSVATQVLDAAITRAARAHGAAVADGYAAFRSRARRSGGDLVAAGLVRSGDVHPTDRGQQLLATVVEDALG